MRRVTHPTGATQEAVGPGLAARRRPTFLALLLAALALVCGSWLLWPAVSHGEADGLVTARDRARAASSYRFAARIDQTLTSRGMFSQASPLPQTVTLTFDGDVRYPDQARLTLHAASGSTTAAPVTILQSGGGLFIQKGSRLEPSAAATGLPGNNTDVLGYLSAAEDVRLLEPIRQGNQIYTRYAFTLNGDRLAAYLTKQLSDRLDRSLGPNIQIQAAAKAPVSAGSGELWIDARGLPYRQILDLALPEINPAYAGQAHLDITFRDFGQVGELPRPVQSSDGIWHLNGESGPPASLTGSIDRVVSPVFALLPVDAQDRLPTALGGWLRMVAPGPVAVLLIVGFGVILATYHRRRWLLRVIAYFTILSLVVSPLLQSLQIAQLAGDYAEAAGQPLASGIAGALASGNAAASPLTESTPVPAGSASADRLAACGQASESVDSDGDGLSDADEACIGTDPTVADSAGSGLPDGLRVFGTDICRAADGALSYPSRSAPGTQSACPGGTTQVSHLTGDPHRPDSIHDGIPDAQKWPQTTYLGKPYGLAESWDGVDSSGNHNGIPNVWNPDIDSDGVPNNLDISPSRTTPYAESFRVDSVSGGYDGYAYLEFQIQPENLDHLLYSQTALSWPYGTQGMIKHLRNPGSPSSEYNDSLHLVPMLLVDSNVAPDPELAEHYGISPKTPEANDQGGYRFMVPLSPFGDGATNYGFYGKVAYGPVNGTVPDIHWKAKLLWVVTAKTDESVPCPKSTLTSLKMCVNTTSTIVQTYDDPARLSGFQVTKSQNVETAVYATPQTPTDDGGLYTIAYGLSSLFLEYESLPDQQPNESFLGRINRHLQDSSASVWDRLGVPQTTTVAISDARYPHVDAAISGVGAALPDFLTQNFPDGAGQPADLCQDAAGTSFRCASAIIAMEQQSGVANLDTLPVNTGPQGRFGITVTLPKIQLATTRGLRMTSYEFKGGHWDTMSLARTLEVMNQRYSGSKLDALLTDLKADYPSLTADDVQFTVGAITSALSLGRTNVIQTGGHRLVPSFPESVGAVVDSYIDSTTTTMKSYYQQRALGAFGLAKKLYVALDEVSAHNTGVAKRLAYLASEPNGIQFHESDLKYTTLLERAGGLTWRSAGFAVLGVMALGNLAFSGFQMACAADQSLSGCGTLVDKDGNPSPMVKAITTLNATYALADTARLATVYAEAARSAAGDARLAGAAGEEVSALSKVSKEAGQTALVVGYVINVGMIWAQFGLAVHASGASGGELNLMIITAVVETIFQTVLFILMLIPIVDIVVAIFQFVDTIVVTFTGFSISGTIVKGIVAAFYNVHQLLDIDQMNFLRPTSTQIAGPDRGGADGLVVGDSIAFTDQFQALFNPNPRDGKSFEWIINDLDQRQGFVGSYALTAPEGGATITTAAPSEANRSTCRESPEHSGYQTSTFLGIAVTRFVRAAECVNEVQATAHFEEARPGVHLQLSTRVHYDIPYTSCSSFIGIKIHCSTDHKSGNSDSGVNDAYFDVFPSTIDGLWNWSADGISNPLKGQQWPSPLTTDAEHDGLVDALEVGLIGSNPHQVDSDADGLSDGGEICRWDPGPKAIVGGWDVVLPSGATARACANPLSAISGILGLPDTTAQKRHVSPYAFFDEPSLDLAITPIRSQPGGKSGAYVQPGDTVAINLLVQNLVTEPVTGTLTVCLPAFLSNLQMVWSGDVIPPAASDPATCSSAGQSAHAWSFAEPTLLRTGDLTQLAVTATVASVGQSITTPISVLLPFKSKSLSRDQNIFVDVDSPAVAITYPANGTMVSRGRTSLIPIRGTSSDPTSWITGVTFQDGQAPAEVTGLTAWSRTWTIPGDGTFTLTAEATDLFGRKTTSAPVTVIVDTTAPSATLSLPGGNAIRPEPDGSAILLQGTASDAATGVTEAQLSIDGAAWQNVPLTRDGSNRDWSFRWQPGAALAQGKHQIAIRAVDGAGNISQPVTQSVVIDAAAPTNRLTTGFFANTPQIKVGDEVAISGRANDAGRATSVASPARIEGTMDILGKATVWLEPGSITDEDQGVTATWLGDVNGDGRADFAVGLPGSTAPDATGTGRIILVNGRAGDWPVPPTDSESLARSPNQFVGAADAKLGAMIAATGDVDGDGHADFVVGDPAHDRAFLILGRTGTYGLSTVLDGSAQRGIVVLVVPAGLRFVTAAGDINGDGFGDLLVGAANTLFVVPGQAGSWSSPLSVADAAIATFPLGPADQAIGLYDADGDGYDDFALTDATGQRGGGSALYIFRGGPGFSAAASAIKFSAQQGTIDGRLARIGNLTGTPDADLAFGTSAGVQLAFRTGYDVGGQPIWGNQFFANSAITPAPTGFLTGVGDIDNDGWNDFLIGNASQDAYLIKGGAGVPAVPLTTLTGVASAASAPASRGADCNCDGYSDLLLIPTAVTAPPRSELSVSALTPVPESSLPVAPSGQPGPVAAPSPIPFTGSPVSIPGAGGPGAPIFTVDDDYCDGCANDGHTLGADAFASVQAAIDAVRLPGTLITVNAGVYGPITIAGSSRNGLTIQGANPDAVFIDGQNGPVAVQIVNADGVGLAGLTLRNALTALDLKAAGVGGENDPTKVTRLAGLVATGFTRGVQQDRISTLAISRSTLASSLGGTYIDVDSTPARQLRSPWSGDVRIVTSEAAPPLLQALVGDTGDFTGNGLYHAVGHLAAVQGKLYGLTFTGDDPNGIGFGVYEPSTGQWVAKAPPPVPSPQARFSSYPDAPNVALGPVGLVDGHDGGIYLLMSGWYGDLRSTPGTLWRYDLARDLWAQIPVIPTATGEECAFPIAMVEGNPAKSLSFIGAKLVISSSAPTVSYAYQLCTYDFSGHLTSLAISTTATAGNPYPLGIPSGIWDGIAFSGSQYSAATWANGQIYLLSQSPGQGTALQKLTLTGSTAALSMLAAPPAATSPGSLVWDGGDYLYGYAFPAGGLFCPGSACQYPNPPQNTHGAAALVRYSLANGTWQSLDGSRLTNPTLAVVPSYGVAVPGQLALLGGQAYLLGLSNGNTDSASGPLAQALWDDLTVFGNTLPTGASSSFVAPWTEIAPPIPPNSGGILSDNLNAPAGTAGIGKAPRGVVGGGAEAVDGKIYTFTTTYDTSAPGGASADPHYTFTRFDPASGIVSNLATMAAAPGGLKPSSIACGATCGDIVDGKDGGIYALGDGVIWRYDIGGDTWAADPGCALGTLNGLVPPIPVRNGDGHTLSVIGLNGLCIFDLSTKVGQILSADFSQFRGGAATWVTDAGGIQRIYVFGTDRVGSGVPFSALYRVTINGTSVTKEALANAPIGASAYAEGYKFTPDWLNQIYSSERHGLVWDGGQYLYATVTANGPANQIDAPGANTVGHATYFARYDLTTGTWESLSPTPAVLDWSSRLFKLGDAIAMNGALRPQAEKDPAYTAGRPYYLPPTLGFEIYRWPIAAATAKLTLSQNALVNLNENVGATWLNLPPVTPTDFTLSATDNRWVGGTGWTPTSPITPETTSLAAAGFIDPLHHNFRLDPTSALVLGPDTVAGYAIPRADAQVSPLFCATCENDGLTWGSTAFTSIQAAINSGANRVYLAPGLYREAFFLTGGVQVIGAGADLTIIEPPLGTPASALASAQGVSGAQISRVTLAGDGQITGLRASSGAQVTLQRAIVRQTGAAIWLDGPTTRVTLLNDNLVNNAAGLKSTNCAQFDLRNSVLAYTTGVALQYAIGGCDSNSQFLNTFNAFFQNATDVDDGTSNPQPGQNSLAIDPSFTDVSQNDFVPLPGSPLINAGSPSDPVPPGVGTIDIGYLETGLAAFVVNADYCATCGNDGLTWQVDAFNAIQPALGAATRVAATLGCVTSDCDTKLTVGVAPGYYTGSLVLPSYVSLLGSGAERTTIDGGGQGSVVTISGATGSSITGFWLVNSGTGPTDSAILLMNGANNITLSRNLIGGTLPMQNAITLTGGATATVDFTTIFNLHGDGIVSDGTGSRARVSNTILNSIAGVGLDAQNGGVIDHYSNLLFNNGADYQGQPDTALISSRPTAPDLTGKDPILAQSDLSLLPGSPAIDAADTRATAPVGGGLFADIGYREVTAAPLVLLFGNQLETCEIGNTGVAQVEIGVSHIPLDQADQPVEATAPTTWTPVPLASGCLDGNCPTTTYWKTTFTPLAEGLYRFYLRATDKLGNVSTDAREWYSGAFAAVEPSQAPAITFTLPTTETSEAALTFTASVNAIIQTPAGPRLGIASTSFVVDGVTWPATWLDDGWTPASGAPRTFRATIPLSNPPIVHTIKAVAIDLAGRRGESAEQTLTMLPSAEGSVANASIIAPVDGGAVNQTTFTVSGFARFNEVSTSNTVTVAVDNGAPVTATLANPAAVLTAWSVPITLPTGVQGFTLKAMASGGPDPWANVLLDQGSPTLQLSAPADGTLVGQPTTLQGTAADAESGLAAIEVSIDNGITWDAANLSQGTWSYRWMPPAEEDGVSHRFLVRARDRAGNKTVVATTLIADTVAPTMVSVTLTNPAFPDGLPVGGHLDHPQPLTLSWPTPTDGSGAVRTLVAVDHQPDTSPTDSVGSTGFTQNLSGGIWYVHFGLRDGAGNETIRHFGPYYVDDRLTTDCTSRYVSVQLDGRIDTTGHEWRASDALLDYDGRSGSTPALYATWDASALYLGWRGAAGGASGTLWAYVGTAAGGSTAPVVTSQAAYLAAGALPFPATYAIEISGPTTGKLWQATGGAWSELGPATFATDGLDTELKLPWSLGAVGSLQLLAFALGSGPAAGQPWAVFPTTNPVNGPWSAAYTWANPCAVAVAGAGQPQTRNVLLTLRSNQNAQAPQLPGSRIEYTVTIQNQDPRALDGAQLQLETSAGLTLSDPFGGTVGVATIPTIPSGASQSLSFAAQINPALTGMTEVTATTSLILPAIGSAILAQESLTQEVDGVIPTVGIMPDQMLSPTQPILQGLAADPGGPGVARVRYRPSGGAWADATGTTFWSASLAALLNGAGGTALTIDLQAIDTLGREGEITPVSIPVVATAPNVAFTTPDRASGALQTITGTAIAQAPASVATVQVQVQGDPSGWQNVTTLLPPASDGTQTWRFAWSPPKVNGTDYTFQARAIDSAGNIGPVVTSDPVSVYATAVDGGVAIPPDQTQIGADQTVTYAVVVTNVGPNPLNQGIVTIPLTGGSSDQTWTCEAVAFSACGARSGTGPVVDTVTLPVGGMVTYRVTAPITDDAVTIEGTATIQPAEGAPDLNPDDNSVRFTVSLDATSPAINIATPLDGAAYLLGDTVRASYTCTDPDLGADIPGSGVATCADSLGGTSDSPGQLDTAAGGAKTFTVTASDHDGNQGSTSVKYAVLVANEDRYAAPTKASLNVPAPGVLANDLPGPGPDFAVTAVLVNQPANGTLTLHPDGSFTYTAKKGIDADQFTYQAQIGGVATPPVTVQILVVKPGVACSGCDLSGMDLSGANLNGSDLSGADLSNTNLSQANLGGANLDRANLSGANLRGARLNNGTRLTHANLTNANLEGANLKGGADLSDAILTGANLTDALLNGADLTRSDLTQSTLTRANLSNADLTKANLTQANGLSTAKLNGVHWGQTTCPDGTNSNQNGGTCVGHG